MVFKPWWTKVEHWLLMCYGKSFKKPLSEDQLCDMQIQNYTNEDPMIYGSMEMEI